MALFVLFLLLFSFSSTEPSSSPDAMLPGVEWESQTRLRERSWQLGQGSRTSSRARNVSECVAERSRNHRNRAPKPGKPLHFHYRWKRRAQSVWFRLSEGRHEELGAILVQQGHGKHREIFSALILGGLINIWLKIVRISSDMRELS